MSASSPTRIAAAAVPRPVVLSMLEDAEAHGYGPGQRDSATAIGVYGSPTETEAADFEHRGRTVRVRPCLSTLTAWEELLVRDPDEWLVLVTDRPDDDLGTGVLAHLVGNKLRTPDPWDAVRQQFGATGIEPALYADADQVALAQGLLESRADAGWPPAPGGALTRAHALHSVARAHLGLRPRNLDALGVLDWSTDPVLAGRIADLRARAGDVVTDATLRWVCAGAGSAAPLLSALVRRGEMADAVPLGLVLDVLLGSGPDGRLGLARAEHLWKGARVTDAALSTLAETSTSVVTGRSGPASRDARSRLLDRAESLARQLDVGHLLHASDVLPGGLTARAEQLADHLRTAAGHSRADLRSDVESSWRRVSEHLLALDHGTARARALLAPLKAAVRLVRWLGTSEAHGSVPPGPAPATLATLARRQADTDAWVDRAINDVREGVTDATIADALGAVLEAVRGVRDRHDEEFARALAESGGGSGAGARLGDGSDGVWLLEHVVTGAVAPIARKHPTLLLVLDGLSTGVATEIVSNVLDSRAWVEHILPDESRRSAALAVLPTLTEFSRTSLLTGKLARGDQATERAGFADLTNSLALGRTSLFHKKPLDTSRPGYAVADDVSAAIADRDQLLVACVLNTIDDALDRSDPAGTSWTADAVKHLVPLLDQARAAGRVVVITADHGHVVERREGTQRKVSEPTSSRSRTSAPPAGDGEVLVKGSRVLTDGEAVLPFDERLRYGPLKAGYHGGAAPAEVVVPLVVLAPDEQTGAAAGLAAAPPQEPAWWLRPVDGHAEDSAPRQVARSTSVQDGPDLFGDLPSPATQAPPPSKPGSSAGIGSAVVKSRTYKNQRKVAGRIVLSDEHVASAVNALAGAPSTRLTLDSLARDLAVPATRARGALAQLVSLLNVEGYAVIRTEGASVILDTALLAEQFALSNV